MTSQLTLKQAIQFCYPDRVPDWQSLSDDVLIELIQDFKNEQSCANSALYELSNRDVVKAIEFAKWILNEQETDEWLKKSAYSVIFLMSSS